VPAPSIDEIERLLNAPVAGVAPVAPWAVTRVTLASGATVLVKWIRDSPVNFRVDLRQAAAEAAALEFLAEIGFDQAPRLLAVDHASGLVAVEDLAPMTPLLDRLRDDGPAPHMASLTAFATTIGRLCATTAGKEAAFEAVRARHGEADPEVGRAQGLGRGWPNARQWLADFGLPIEGAAAAELARVEAALVDPGPFCALSNGDPQTNNFLTDGQSGALIDFEWAAFRNAFTTTNWISMPGSAWITVAHDGSPALEDAWRAAASPGIPQVADDAAFAFGVAMSALAEACDRIIRFPLMDGRPAGHQSRLQMVSTLESAAAVARRHGALLPLADWSERVAAWLRRRWPDADQDLATIRPFTPRR
jgi:hypothetical protein